jgi:hypothetical protein
LILPVFDLFWGIYQKPSKRQFNNPLLPPVAPMADPCFNNKSQSDSYKSIEQSFTLFWPLLFGA